MLITSANKTILSFLLMVLFIVNSSTALDKHIVRSPDQQVQFVLTVRDGEFQYQVQWQGKEIVHPSALSILPNKQVTIKRVALCSMNRSWKPVWGQFSEIRDNFEELVLSLSFEGLLGKLVCRAYNTGVAFRFVLDENQNLNNVVYQCEFNLGSGNRFYYPSGEKEPLGPVSVNDISEDIKLPVVVENNFGNYLAILESDLYSAPGFGVMNIRADKELGVLVSKNNPQIKKGKVTTPWRVILLEKNVGDLLTDTIPVNLAAPNKLEDVSWIKPGKAMWDWRVHGYTAPDGFKYGANSESYLRFIDFASKNNIDYFLIDNAWYTTVSRGQINQSDELDLSRVSRYAKDKEVNLILYYDRKHGNYGDDALFNYYRELGMRGIKYGFMGEDVAFTKNAVTESAHNKLLIDFHDNPVPFTGIRRTFPNAMTREYCHAQLDDRRAFSPETFIKMALINAIQGPLDMNNGNFDISGINRGGREKGPTELNSYFTTVTSEIARVLIIFTGIACLPDAPEDYEAKADLFEFLQKLPIGKWDESRILLAKMGEYISTARRHGEEWFIGSVVDGRGGELPLHLDFLKRGLVYEATFYEDAYNTHYKNNPEAYVIRKGTVKKGDVIIAKMAPGGGHAIWIRPRR